MREAMAQYGPATLEIAGKLRDACRQVVPACTIEQIKAAITAKMRDKTGVRRPASFLLKTVPEIIQEVCESPENFAADACPFCGHTRLIEGRYCAGCTKPRDLAAQAVRTAATP